LNVNRLLSGDLSREEFRTWFAPVLWSADELDSELAAVVYDIEIAFAELDAGYWSNDRFNAELGSIERRIRSLAAA
jgi:hypothetical protein